MEAVVTESRCSSVARQSQVGRRALRRPLVGSEPQRETEHPENARVSILAGDVVVLRGNLTTMPEGSANCGVCRSQDVICEARTSWPQRVAAVGARDSHGPRRYRRAFQWRSASSAPLWCSVLLKALTLREAYETLDWPILIMLGALIPVSDALRTTGGTELIAGLLSATAEPLPAPGALALILVAAMAVTPFLNNANRAGHGANCGEFRRLAWIRPDTVFGGGGDRAACDFLTPIGHQSNRW